MCVFHRYVKTYLLPDKSNHSKKKTSVKKKTLNPVYDQTLRVRLSVIYMLHKVSITEIPHHNLTTVTRITKTHSCCMFFQYKVRIGELRSRTLNLSVWHAEPLGRNVFLGEVEVTLALWDWTCTQPLWQDLQPRVGRTWHQRVACKHTLL